MRMVVVRPEAGERGKDDSVLQLHSADLEGLEERRDLGRRHRSED